MKRGACKAVSAAASAASSTSTPALPVFARLLASDGLELRILVVPGSRSNEVVGIHGDRLKLKVQAPPEKGKANEDVCELLSDLTGKKGVAIVAGFTSREKTVVVPGISSWNSDWLPEEA